MSPQTVQRYQGVVVPMVTPVTAGGDLDELAVRRIVDHLIAGGVAGIFVLGTTGENASIPASVRLRLIAVTIEQAAGRAMTYAGISDNCFATSIEAGEAFARLGVDACVAHPPYYYALVPDEQYTYFAALADRLPAPLMLYNIPSTTHMSLDLEVIRALADHRNIIGLKDSERNEERLKEVMRLVGGRDDFAVLVGAAPLSALGLTLGANGSVPSSGNLAPDLCQRLHEAGSRGDHTTAQAYQEKIDRIAAAYQRGRTLGQTLGALKTAMGALGLCDPYMLPPLRALPPAEQEQVRQEYLRLRAEIGN